MLSARAVMSTQAISSAALQGRLPLIARSMRPMAFQIRRGSWPVSTGASTSSITALAAPALISL